MTIQGTLLLVGGGKMGGALLEGWLARGVEASSVHVVEPGEEARKVLAAHGVNAVAAAEELPAELRPGVVILAVKPQVMDKVVPDYRRFVAPDTVFLSIAAGRTIASFEAILGSGAAVVRSIPNTPSAVGRGVTVLCANANVGAEQKDACDELLRGVGETGWVEDESLIDAVTAVSGSGPAYVFYMIECLAAAGIDAGLPEDLATRIASATVSGAGELARRSGEPAAQLRRNVTSPGGTTEAALNVLMADDGLEPLMRKAVAAAARRSRELAG
ncbi:pyrroline-5-carboxylate reductase [Ferruginivarius sediminum]|uniref:Pyrroline-5-carboxylate reductase n=1 Tax=Ferruginivarius sediminum TaxID=2661937 RepID=A0A369T6D6_9PROT|nr:pyrroline-5-carboxylate reductase [Ferruginivarius sediminum]RDD60889.1 pyrroline-5-carboxylate reductase [Ferruginivarius sediminum]